MKRCSVCHEEVYRNFSEHVRMHQRAARRRHLKRHPQAVYAFPVEIGEMIGVGTEIRPLPVTGIVSRIWSQIKRVFGLGS